MMIASLVIPGVCCLIVSPSLAYPGKPGSSCLPTMFARVCATPMTLNRGAAYPHWHGQHCSDNHVQDPRSLIFSQFPANETSCKAHHTLCMHAGRSPIHASASSPPWHVRADRYRIAFLKYLARLLMARHLPEMPSLRPAISRFPCRFSSCHQRQLMCSVIHPWVVPQLLPPHFAITEMPNSARLPALLRPAFSCPARIVGCI
ncbi:hypothetical protein B0I35DRAFT_55348 [Stachybotrys elegans]|uniref:Secreted protein n=1 Tax=Stachybotrys elegans TaxID=80388 RepID=A0A8K0SQR3_9HYPO|nr:hypothetical protein B0I35DRAFT_55348 [Stachybotrys elegans]